MKGREEKIPRSAKSVILCEKETGPEIGARKGTKTYSVVLADSGESREGHVGRLIRGEGGGRRV